MSFVKPHTVNGAEIPGVFTKVSTKADVAGFASQLEGRRQLISRSTAEEIPNSPTGTQYAGVYRFTIDFNYIVGAKQLLVFWQFDNVALGNFAGWGLIPDYETASQLVGFDISVNPFYEEETSNTVILYNVNNLSPGIPAGQNNALMFLIPHTATPASRISRVVVEDQGDNVGIEMLGNGDGILLKSASGKQVLINVDDNGNIITRLIR